MEWLLYVLAAGLILVGVVGTVMPGIPGIPLVFAGMALAAAVESFRLVSLWTLAALAALTVLSVVIEYLAAALGARRVGASPWAMAGAVLGGLAGIAFGPIGMLVGPLVGAVAGELLARRDLRQAGRAGLAAWLGFLVGTLAKAGIVVVMLVVFGAALIIR
jgi:uncharacterized protein YqgC (DUF456 family)